MMYYFGLPLKFFGFSKGKIPEVADLVIGQIAFQSGTVFQGAWNFNAPESETREKCLLLGSRGKIEFSFFREKECISLDSEEKKEKFEFSHPENIQLPMIDKVVRYFRGEGENPCAGEDGLKVMEIIDSFTEISQ